MSLNIVDILFVVTVLLLVFNGLRNGAIFSLINLLSIPVGFAAAQMFGGPFTQLLAANGLAVTPFIAYVVVFFGAVLILHIIATSVRGVVQKIPIIGFGDSLRELRAEIARSGMAPLGCLLNGVGRFSWRRPHLYARCTDCLWSYDPDQPVESMVRFL